MSSVEWTGPWASKSVKDVNSMEEKPNKLVLDPLDNSVVLKGTLSEKGRGMELSELTKFNNHLLAFDDRTGSVCVICGDTFTLIPKALVMESDGGTRNKGMKLEWATVKNTILHMGSFGREYTSALGDNIIESLAPLWIAQMNQFGHVKHVNWSDKYEKLRRNTGVDQRRKVKSEKFEHI